MAYNSVLAYVKYDGVRQTALDEDRDLWIGATYTPSLHLPAYDPANYELVKIEVYAASLGGILDYTTGSFTVPSDYCDICYYFEAKPPAENTVLRYRSLDGGGLEYLGGVTMTVGASYTPSAHVPYYDSTRWRLDRILVYARSLGGTVDYTTGSFAVPSDYCDVTYYLVSRSLRAYIDSGSSWARYRAYIDNGRAWERYQIKIDGGASWLPS